MLGIGGIGSMALWRSGHAPVAAFDAFVMPALAVVGAGLLVVGFVLGRRRRNPPAA